MATITNNMTRIHDAEGTLTTGNIPAGGAAASANTDIFLQGAQSLGKRITVTATTEGFALVDGADNDVSATSVHVGLWFWVTHYAILDDVRLVFSTGTTPATNYDAHTFPLAEFPELGGFVRAWVDISRIPDFTNGTALNEAQLRCYGVMISFSSTPGGNAANLIVDSADYVAGAALTSTGTSGLWTDFTTADENSTNQYGVFRNVGGVYNCFARIQLGTSGSSLVFNDSNFAIVFPNQSLVETTFMGINVNLENGSTNIDWSGGVIKSAGSTRQGDLVVTGTSGDFDATNMTLSALRVVTLTSASSITGSSFVGCGQITAAGANLSNSTVSGYEGTADTAALVWNVNTDTDNLLDGMTFTKGTAATHAIELGTSSPTSVTFKGITFSGYNASNGQNDSTILVSRTTGTVTITITGGGTTPSYKTAGATVVIVTGVISLTINGLVSGDRVGLFRTTGSGSTTVDKSMYTMTSQSSGIGTVTVSTAIAGDTPSAGIIYVVDASDSSEQRYSYASWSGSVFTLSGTTSRAYDTNDKAYVPFIDTEATGTTASVNISYTADRNVVTKVRRKGILPFTVTGQITNSNFTSTAVRTFDSVVD